MGKDFLETLLHIAILKSITPTTPNILIIAITLFIVLLPIYLIAKISQISRKKDPVVIYQAPPAIENKTAPPLPSPPKEDLNDKIREEIRRQVELEVHQQLKDIRQRLEKDIEIGITAYIHKQRARQARAQESKDKK